MQVKARGQHFAQIIIRNKGKDLKQIKIMFAQ